MVGCWDHVRRTSPDWPHLEEAAALAADLGRATAGNTLVHTDARDDNFLLPLTGRAYLCDWNFPVRGAAWIDTVSLLMTASGDGMDADALLAEPGADPQRRGRRRRHRAGAVLRLLPGAARPAVAVLLAVPAAPPGLVRGGLLGVAGPAARLELTPVGSTAVSRGPRRARFRVSSCLRIITRSPPRQRPPPQPLRGGPAPDRERAHERRAGRRGAHVVGDRDGPNSRLPAARSARSSCRPGSNPTIRKTTAKRCPTASSSRPGVSGARGCGGRGCRPGRSCTAPRAPGTAQRNIGRRLGLDVDGPELHLGVRVDVRRAG